MKAGRRVTLVAAGLITAASLGLTGLSPAAASGAVSRLRIMPGSQWTIEVNSSISDCEIDTFHANGTFKGDKGTDVGIWSGGRATLTMTWTAGNEAGLSFSGIFTKTPSKEYSGVIIENGSSTASVVVKGAVSTC
jgi:hypothetical protein